MYLEFIMKPVSICRLYQTRLAKYTPNELNFIDLSSDNHDLERLLLGLKRTGHFSRLVPDAHMPDVDKAIRT
jgi:hypothetical protein